MLIHSLRPKLLDGLIGQKGALTALLKYKADHGDWPQVILLSGPTGCGKTSVARIIAGGESFGFTEVDAATVNGVDAMRKLTTEMQSLPMIGAVRTIMLDECHRLSAEASDILLKPLEAVPEHGRWILGSSEPGRIKKALLGRCFHVKLVPLSSVEQVYALLEPAGGSRADAARLFAQGLVNPRDILGAFETAVRPESIGLTAFEAAQALYRSDFKPVLEFVREADQAEIINFQFVAAAYGRTLLKNKGAVAAGRILEAILTPNQPEPTLRCAAITLQIHRLNSIS